MKKFFKWFLPIILVIIFFLIFAPVSFDSGACAGGFKKSVTDTYENKFLTLLAEKKIISLYQKDNPSINQLELIENMTWKGRIIRTKAKITVNGKSYLVEYEGKRYWIEKYAWEIKSIRPL